MEICPNPISFHRFGFHTASYRPKRQCCIIGHIVYTIHGWCTSGATLMFGSITFDVAYKLMKTHRIWTDLYLRSPKPVSKVLGVVHNPSYKSEMTLDLTSMTNLWGMMIDVTLFGFWLLTIDVALKLRLRPRIRTDLVECFTKMVSYVA